MRAEQVERRQHDDVQRRVLGGRDVLQRPPEAVPVGQQRGLRVVGRRVADHRVVAVEPRRDEPHADGHEDDAGEPGAEGPHRAEPYALAVSSRPPDALAPPPGNPRFPLLDPLRAVAALCIVVTHTAGLGGFNQAHALGAWTARLDCGVAIFFVLSGFLLYRPFVAARLEGRPGPRVGRYARRRALRILPAYWVALILLGLIVPQYTPGVFGHDWWVYFGLLQSWSANTILGGISATWSLSVELAFYVLLPFYALALRRASVRTELVVLGVSAVAAVVVRTLVGSGRRLPQHAARHVGVVRGRAGAGGRVRPRRGPGASGRRRSCGGAARSRC